MAIYSVGRKRVILALLLTTALLLTLDLRGNAVIDAGREGFVRVMRPVETATGVVTFGSAPGAGVAVTAGFEFDVPVRFDSDALDVTLDIERLGSITSIPLLEIRR